MARWDDFDYGEPTNRPAAVARHLNRIGLSLEPGDKRKLGQVEEDPAIAERRALEARERLAAHDRLFHLDGGLEGSLLRVSRQHYDAGDPEGDADLG